MGFYTLTISRPFCAGIPLLNKDFCVCFVYPTGGQMQGAYDVGSQSVVDLLNNARQQNEAGQNSSSARRRRRAVSSFSFKAVPNPTVCLTHGSHMIWKVSNSDYPKYDKNSLFNTNPSFDDGPFKDLEERHQLESTRFELFAYKFDKEGVYVFSSSKNPENVMVSWNSYQAFILILPRVSKLVTADKNSTARKYCLVAFI